VAPKAVHSATPHTPFQFYVLCMDIYKYMSIYRHTHTH
jgi:hypothetical protein